MVSVFFADGDYMGYTFEIWDYYEDRTDGKGRADHLVYSTNNWLFAFWMLFKVKRDSHRVTMIWR